MLLSEIEDVTRQNHLVHQLFSVKRCFGGHSSIGVVVGSGVETDRCSTIAELVLCGHVPSGFEWLDPFLSAVPKVSENPCNIDMIVTPPRYNDGPPCPWDVALAEQQAARARVALKKLHRRRGCEVSLPCVCLCPTNLENGMSYKYEDQKEWLFTDEGQRKFLAIRDKVFALLKTSGAFMMENILSGGDWECLACVDRMVELHEIREIPQIDDFLAGQHRVFVKVSS